MGALQIDTIHVVARSPYFVLWSRLGDYPQRWLDELLAEGALFEYWSHAACFLPIEQYPHYRRLMLDGLKGRQVSRQWLRANAAAVETMLARIAERGPVRSADFTRTGGKGNGWWDWKPEKRLLEALHTDGALMIARRQNFQRLYDLRERVLPAWNDNDTPPLEESLRSLTLLAVKALGVTTAAWTPDYFRLPVRAVQPLVHALAQEGRLIGVEVEGWDSPGFVHPDNAELLTFARAGALQTRRTVLLSPFDPVVWHRTRALSLFGFDYRLESYTPEAQRRYGYFTLPLLHRDALVGRVDAAARRSAGVFEVKALHLEAGVTLSDDLVAAAATALSECAAWHGTPEVVVRSTDPPALAAAMRTPLSR
jgi:uncharacterized protein YcaQ